MLIQDHILLGEITLTHKQGFHVARTELIHVSDLASDLGIAKMHHRQEFEYYCI